MTWQSVNGGWCWKSLQEGRDRHWKLWDPNTTFCQLPALPCYFASSLGQNSPFVGGGAFCDHSIVSEYDLGLWASQHGFGRQDLVGDDVRKKIWKFSDDLPLPVPGNYRFFTIL